MSQGRITRRLFAATALSTGLAVSGLGLQQQAQAAPGQGRAGKEISFKASNGDSSTYRYYPANGSSDGLLVYLDGDGQWGYLNPSSSWALGGQHGIVAQANSRGFSVLAVKAPSADLKWWTRYQRKVLYFHELLQHVQRTIGYNNNNLVLTGYSGGAQFITQSYLPMKGNSIGGGGVIVFGGGGVPEVRKDEQVPFSANLKKNLWMCWVTGTDDTAANSPEGYDGLAEAMAGKRYYASQGFSTWSHWPEGVDHEEIGGQFGGYIGMILDSD